MMKHNMKYSFLSVTAALAVLTLTGCQHEELTVNNPAGNDILNFSVGFAGSGEIVLTKGATLTSQDGTVSIPLSSTVTDGINVNLPGAAESAKATKGTQINSEAEMLTAELESFTAAGWNSDKTEFIPLSTTVSYTDGLWQTAGTYRWRGSDNKVFLAYANLPTSGAAVLNSADPVKQTFTYTVPTDARQQNDVMLGWYEGDGDGTSTAAITMVHPLTAVVFKKGVIDENVTAIKSISIKGVYVNGTADVTYDLSGSDVVPAYNWGSSRTGSQTVTLSPAAGATELEVAEDGKIGTSFIILPQTIAANTVSLDIVVVGKGEDVTITAFIPAGQWEEGKTNTYTLGYDGGEFTLSASDGGVVSTEFNLNHYASTKSITVTSYKTFAGSDTKIPVPWEFEFSTDGGNTWSRTAPDWIFSAPSASAPTGISTDSEIIYEGLIRTLNGETATRVANMLSRKGTTEWSTTAANRKDLSNGGETANCYIVNTSGYFKIPLVYGNARKADGTANSQAFSSTAYEKTEFLNYQNNQISNMYIYNDITSKQCTDATLVWQDQPDLVTNVKLSSDKHFIEFDIADDCLIDGNAIVAVRDNDGKIMWSWHIWVTDFVPAAGNNEALSYDATTVYFMQHEVGECPPTDVTYGPSRSCLVRIIQKESLNSTTLDITLSQPAKNVVYGYNAPFYQHGRKDPELPSDGLGNNDKQIFTTDSKYLYRSAPDNQDPANHVTMDVAIQNPNVHYNYTFPNSTAHWLKPTTNYWGGNLDALPGHVYLHLWGQNVKTVYDPSPVGYRVPSGGMFALAFTNLIDAAHTSFQNSAPYGFFCTIGGQTVFLHSFGHRQWTGAALGDVNAQKGCEHWGDGLYAAGPGEEGLLGYSLFFDEGQLRLKQGWTSGNISYPIKPCTDN